MSQVKISSCSRHDNNIAENRSLGVKQALTHTHTHGTNTHTHPGQTLTHTRDKTSTQILWEKQSIFLV